MIEAKGEKIPLLRFLLFAFVCLTIILGFGFPARAPLVERSGIFQLKCEVGDRTVDNLSETIAEEKPEIILLGNSLLGRAVDQETVSAELGKKTLVVWLGGGSSAWWYLVIKNVIVPSSAKPQHVVIFFRDNFLTLPFYRAKGRYKKRIDNFAEKEEFVLDRLLYFNRENHWALILKTYVPFFREGEQLDDRLRTEIKRISARLLGLDGAEHVNKLIEQRFDESRFAVRFSHIAQLAEDDFLENKNSYAFSPENTFLPHIIRLCEENRIKLTFVRGKRLRDTVTDGQSDDLKRYISQLQSYLTERQVPLIDYTYYPGITKAYFGKGDHLNNEVGRPAFSKLFADDLRQALR